MTSRVLVIASESELPAGRRIWGTGGWLPPEQREALDWLTLVRLLGWDASVAWRNGRELSCDRREEYRWIIVACNPDSVSEDVASLLAKWLEETSAMIVTRAPAADTPLARLTGASHLAGAVAGISLEWTGPHHELQWSTKKRLRASAMNLAHDVTSWATLDGASLIAARRVGRGTVATLGAHPSAMRDAGGAGTALLRHLLTAGLNAAVAWLDFEATMVLRMDDPGGAQNVHSRDWYYPKIDEAGWAALANDLRRRNARLSVLYTPGWVDDGDEARGALTVAGARVPRVAGTVHPAAEVVYEDAAGHAPATRHDYTSEFRGIQALRGSGLGDVELHGYTHMHPDSTRWAAAPDRYENLGWFRELGSVAAATIAARPPAEHPLSLGIAALRRYFGVTPTTVVAPGDEWTEEVLEVALDAGLQLVDSYYLALRHDERFCWTTHVCAPYLDKADAEWFAAGLPVVGYFHDREPALNGVAWMSHCLDRWQEVGARRLIDFRELAGALGRRVHIEGDDSWRLRVYGRGGPPLVRPLPVAFRTADRRLPSELPVTIDEREVRLPVREIEAGVGRIELPPEPRAWSAKRIPQPLRC